MNRYLYLSLLPGPWREIVAGRKKNEYRDYTDYYKRRLVAESSDVKKDGLTKCSDGVWRRFVPYTHIMFLRGKERMAVEIKGIDVDGNMFVISLGKIVATP